MKKDNRICRGDYESAMHYDCAECLARCKYRKETKPVLLISIIGIVVVVSLALLLF